MGLALICLLLLLTLAKGAVVKMGFPKIIWVYWDSGIQNAPLVTQLCVQNMKRVATNSGWQINILNKQTVSQYIYDKKRYQSILGNAKVIMGLQKQADVIRLFLIYNYGGVWIDANTFFIEEDMSWLENIEQESIIQNKHGNDPDVILFTLNDIQGDLRISIDQNSDNSKILLCPGNEVWFIIAKPKTKLIREWLAQFQLYIKSGYEYVRDKNQREGTIISSWSLSFGKDYLFANRAIQSVLQQKQKQLDRDQKPGQSRNYAVWHYNLWSIGGGATGYHIQDSLGWATDKTIEYLTKKTYKQVEAAIGASKFFIKMNGALYGIVSSIIDPDVLLKPVHLLDRLRYVFSQITQVFQAFPLVCKGISLPSAYIVKDSYVEHYLIRESQNQKVKQIQLFERDQILKKCSRDLMYNVKLAVGILSLVVAVGLQILFIRNIFKSCTNRTAQRNGEIQLPGEEEF